MTGDDRRGARQLAFPLPHEPAQGRADFLVGAANAAALASIESWPDWPYRAVVLVGPAGSGKSHLLAIWRALSGAPVVPAAALASGQADGLLDGGALAIEDIDRGADEAALFHALNLARERDADLLLTSRAMPAELPLVLPDLVSRLRAAQPLRLAEPDDDLLRQVLVKLFADRQLIVDRTLIDYIVRYGERSLAAANDLVERVDRVSLEARKPIGRGFIQQILAEQERARGFDPPTED
jgi:chromosomal replication initiation ATPase DnaA